MRIKAEYNFFACPISLMFIWQYAGRGPGPGLVFCRASTLRATSSVVDLTIFLRIRVPLVSLIWLWNQTFLYRVKKTQFYPASTSLVLLLALHFCSTCGRICQEFPAKQCGSGSARPATPIILLQIFI